MKDLSDMVGAGIKTLGFNRYGGQVIVTQDAGAGSSGKGALNSWLATKIEFEWATCNWSPNAGHFVELDDGRRILTQHIPSAFVSPNTSLFMNAGGMIDIDILKAELDTLEGLGFKIRDRFSVHPNAVVITQENRDHEKSVLKYGSTFKGCGSATAHKAMRSQPLARDFGQALSMIGVTVYDATLDIVCGARDGLNVLIEGAQGMDLDLNRGEYPYCTSRQTWPAQLVADACVPMSLVTNTILNLRPHPIRISNTSAADGTEKFSGNYWGAKEITWDEVATRAGFTPEEFMALYGPALITSVTKKTRRVFEFPTEHFRWMWGLVGGPDDRSIRLSLNFANWIDKDLTGVTDEEALSSSTKLIKWVNDHIPGAALSFIRTGPKLSQCVEV